MMMMMAAVAKLFHISLQSFEIGKAATAFHFALIHRGFVPKVQNSPIFSHHGFNPH